MNEVQPWLNIPAKCDSQTCKDTFINAAVSASALPVFCDLPSLNP